MPRNEKLFPLKDLFFIFPYQVFILLYNIVRLLHYEMKFGLQTRPCASNTGTKFHGSVVLLYTPS